MSVSAAAGDSSPEEGWHQGLKAYKAGELETSKQHFEAVIRSGWHSPGTYFNLGIAYAQMGDYGPAMLALERALLMDAANLNYRAHHRHVYELAGADHSRPIHTTAVRWLPATVWSVLGIVAFWLGLALILLPRCIGWQKSLRRERFAWALLLFSLACAWACIDYAGDFDDGLIIVAETPLKVAPTTHSPVERYLRLGDRADFLQAQRDYVQVLIDGRKGWVNRRDFELIYGP